MGFYLGNGIEFCNDILGLDGNCEIIFRRLKIFCNIYVFYRWCRCVLFLEF